MSKYCRASMTNYFEDGRQRILILSCIPAVSSEKIENFERELQAEYSRAKATATGLADLSVRVTWYNFLMAIPAKKGGFHYKRNLMPLVMEVRARVPDSNQSDDNGNLFDELEGIVDATLTRIYKI